MLLFAAAVVVPLAIGTLLDRGCNKLDAAVCCLLLLLLLLSLLLLLPLFTES